MLKQFPFTAEGEEECIDFTALFFRISEEKERLVIPAKMTHFVFNFHLRVADLLSNFFRTSILLSSAYVCLCLNDFVLARQYAEKLLKQPRLSGVHK